MVEKIANFITAFHGALELGEKLRIIGAFLSDLGVQQAFFVSKDDFCKRKFLPILNVSETYLQDIDGDISIEDLKKDDRLFRTIGNTNFTVMPIYDEEKFYGTLFFYPYIEEHRDVYRILREVACFGIRSCEFGELFKHRTRQFESFRKLAEKIGSYYTLQDLLNMLAENVTHVLNAKGTVIRLVNKEKQVLGVSAEYGLGDVHIRRHGIPKGDGVSGEVWQQRSSKLVLPNTEESSRLLKSKLGVSSLICVPLMFENDVIGTLSVYEGLGERVFTEEDRYFLETIATFVSPVIAYTSALDTERLLLSKLEKHIKDLTLITEINKILMEPRRLDELLYILLTTLTFGEEIGFNRAVLFMWNEKTGTMQGMMGIGCDTVEEAWRVWQQLPKGVSAVEWVEKIKGMKLDNDTTFNNRVKTFRFFLDEVPSFSEVYKTGKVYVVKEAKDLVAKFFDVSEYALIPLIGREGILGMLYVDNKFTYKSIDEYYIKLLETFASQASIAIENTKLYNELKETNDMLKSAKQELLIKEKLAVVGEMLTTLAHEVRNPLTAIGGFAKVILRRSDNPTIKELTQKILNQTERVNAMFNDFLYLTKTNTFRNTTCDVKKVITDSLTNLSFLLTEEVKLKLDIAPSLPCVPIDASVLGVVIDNIIKNAVQAMEGKGELRIICKQEENFVSITVEDEGPGISNDILPHIFDPFYTTKFNGIGIGLSVSYKIIRQHNGIIYAENKAEGKGARFVVKLPISCELKEVKNEGGL